jgi:anti-sigma factor RsiW
MRCEEAQELITALVDNELSQKERQSIETHLTECQRCQFIYKEEEALKRQIRLASAKVSAPAGLREKILSDRRIFPERRGASGFWKGLLWPQRTTLLPTLVVATLIIIILLLPTIYLMRPGGEPISLSAVQTHQKILTGDIALAKATSQEELKERLVRSVEARFGPMGYDLSMMGLQAVSGLVQEAGGRKMLVTIYEGKGLTLSCFTFLGTENDAPPNAALFFDPEKKMNFYSFSNGRINGVMHREGDVICILVSEMPMQDLLALARSKAQPS